MPTIVGPGDRLITREGRASWLKRGSTPLSFWAGGGHISLTGAQTISYQQLYETQPWVGVAVNKLNRQIARLPLKTYRLLEGTKSDGERERVRDHPLPDLLRRPWPRRGPIHLKQKLGFPALLHGNSVLAKVRDVAGGPTVGFAPLDWRYLIPRILNDDGVIDFWETEQTGERKYLSPDDVIHVAWDAGMGDLGVSPLKQLGLTLKIEDAAQRYQSASFENGVRHSAAYVLPPDVEMDKDDKEELRQSLTATQGGVDRAFQLALITGGGDIRPLSYSAVEAELIDQRKLNREDVAAVYDIPPPLIGILDHATYSNVAEMHRMLFGTVLGPWLVLIEETLQAQLIDAYEPWREERLFCEFDLAEVLRGDVLKEVLAIKEAIHTGIMTPNEGRQIRNQAASDQAGMDQFYLPVNNLQSVGAQPDPDTDAVVKTHLGRAVQRIATKMGAGAEPWDRDRFMRELAADLNGDGDEVAAAYADTLEELVTESGGDPAAFRALVAPLI